LLLVDVDALNLEYKCNDDFRNFFRMSSSEFENLLQLIDDQRWSRHDTFRKAILAKERLVTLRFLMTGEILIILLCIFLKFKKILLCVLIAWFSSTSLIFKMARPFGKADRNEDAANNQNFNCQRRMLKKANFLWTTNGT